MSAYGIYIGFDFVSIVSSDIDTSVITPIVVYPIDRTADRQREVNAAIKKIASQKLISPEKSSFALLAFESPENQLFITDISKEMPDIIEMASWELFMRIGEPVKNYNISTFHIQENKYLVAAAKKHDINFFTKQIKRLGLKTITIEPSLVSAINLLEHNLVDVKGENLIALLSGNKINIAYIKDGNVIDTAQNTVNAFKLISSEDIMKIRAEITQRNKLSKDVKMYITGDLLADKKYADKILSDMINCECINPFKRVKIGNDSDKELIEKYSSVFGVSLSLSQKMV